jgi:RNA polymerase sigma factor (sigma-70 family)
MSRHKTKVTVAKPSSWTAAELGDFFVAYRTEFLSHARRVVGSSGEAEEIVQDALVRVLLAAPELESPDHARAYFHRVVDNLGIDHLRRRGRAPQLIVLDDEIIMLEQQWLSDDVLADDLARADDAALIREAISLMSPAERAALVMWEFEGRSTQEIAQELGVKESTVRHTVSRARTSLRRLLAQRIIDEERGLTALDLLSVGYRKAEKIARKSAKVALSLVLILSAFLGFQSLSSSDFSVPGTFISPESQIIEEDSRVHSPNGSPVQGGDERDTLSTSGDPAIVLPRSEKSSSQAFSAQATDVLFPGLDVEGVPTGFTVVDSLGSIGSLFVGRQKPVITETGFLLSNIVSTKAGSTNVLINQSLVLDAFGTSYIADVSVGINGGWQPLRLSFVSSEMKRLASGNYLLTAIMMVDSAIETSVKVSTGTSGTDLSSAPDFLSTRLVLDETKSKILAQAVLVSADSQRDGA